jgi:hypothetical protein
MEHVVAVMVVGREMVHVTEVEEVRAPGLGMVIVK